MSKVPGWIVMIGLVLIFATGCQPLVTQLQRIANTAATPATPSIIHTPEADQIALTTPTIVAEKTTLPTAGATQAVTTTQPTNPPSVHLTVRTEGNGPNIWILDGDGVNHFQPGDSLIIYGVLLQGTETAIAQVQVIAQNPNSLLVQVMLVDPGQAVRSGLRADANLAMLEESMLIPAAAFADGYVLADKRIRLRPGHDLAVGTVFQAFEAQKIGQRISDYLPFSPPLLMQIAAIGVTGEVASAELISGEWPAVGTLVSNAGMETAEASTVVSESPTPTPIPPPIIPTETPIPSATSMTVARATPDIVATGVAERNAQQTAIAATLTAQISLATAEPPANTPYPPANTAVPSVGTIEILDPKWSESRQGWQTVRWRYTGELKPGQGFDLMLWYVEEDRRRGITDARSIAAKLERHGNNEYSVLINFSAAAAVEQYCDAKYLLAVTVVELEPYRQIGPQSAGVQIQVAPLPGGSCG